MSKINKYANLYDKEGNLINKVDADGVLHDLTIEQVEHLLDDYANKSKENPDNELYKVYINNLYRWLMYLYQTQGNPHKEEIMKQILATQNTENQQVTEALEEVNKTLKQEDLLVDRDSDTKMDEYVDYTEIEDHDKEGNDDGDNA